MTNCQVGEGDESDGEKIRRSRFSVPLPPSFRCVCGRDVLRDQAIPVRSRQGKQLLLVIFALECGWSRDSWRVHEDLLTLSFPRNQLVKNVLFVSFFFGSQFVISDGSNRLKVMKGNGATFNDNTEAKRLQPRGNASTIRDIKLQDLTRQPRKENKRQTRTPPERCATLTSIINEESCESEKKLSTRHATDSRRFFIIFVFQFFISQPSRPFAESKTPELIHHEVSMKNAT